MRQYPEYGFKDTTLSTKFLGGPFLTFLYGVIVILLLFLLICCILICVRQCCPRPKMKGKKKRNSWKYSSRLGDESSSSTFDSNSSFSSSYSDSLYGRPRGRSPLRSSPRRAPGPPAKMPRHYQHASLGPYPSSNFNAGQQLSLGSVNRSISSTRSFSVSDPTKESSSSIMSTSQQPESLLYGPEQLDESYRALGGSPVNSRPPSATNNRLNMGKFS